MIRVANIREIHLCVASQTQVAVPDDPTNAINPDGFIIGENRTARICTLIEGQLTLVANTPSWLLDGEEYVAGPCP